MFNYYRLNNIVNLFGFLNIKEGGMVRVCEVFSCPVREGHGLRLFSFQKKKSRAIFSLVVLGKNQSA